MIQNSNWVEPCARRAAAYRSIIRTAPASACWAAPRAARPGDACALPRTGIDVRGRTGREKNWGRYMDRKHPPRTAEGHSPRPPIWPTRHDPIPRACGEGPGWGFDARSLLLRSDLAQAVDDAALRRHRVFREARP